MSTDPEEHGPETPAPAAPAAASANGPRTASGPRPAVAAGEATSAELLGQLAHELTSLLRTELQLNQCEHAAGRRQRASEIAALAAGAAAGLMAFAALTAATVKALEFVLSAWAASLVAAAAWGILAVVLLQAGKLSKLLARFDPAGDEARLERLQDEQRAGEVAMQQAAGRFAQAAARETVDSVAKRATDAVDQEGELLLRELAGLLRAPGRAGIGVLGRLAGR
jgi:Putative Actinobacterial Holin-X, holin superfamily III